MLFPPTPWTIFNFSSLLTVYNYCIACFCTSESCILYSTTTFTLSRVLDATRRISINIRFRPPFRHRPSVRSKTMFSTSLVSRSSLRRLPRSGFNQGSVSSTRVDKILHTATGSFPYSTSTSNPNGIPLSALPPLPDQSEWRPVFNPPSSPLALRERISIRNPDTARALAEGFTRWTKPLIKADGSGSVSKRAPKVIIEAFPGTPHACTSRHLIHNMILRPLGPGALTRALLTLPRDSFDKLIVLEEQPGYLEYLKVTEPLAAHTRSTSCFTTVEPDKPSVLRSH